MIGLAGLAGVAATGVVLARNERRRRAYTPEEVRTRLQERYAQAEAAAAVSSGPGAEVSAGSEAASPEDVPAPDPGRLRVRLLGRLSFRSR